MKVRVIFMTLNCMMDQYSSVLLFEICFQEDCFNLSCLDLEENMHTY